MKSGSGKYTEEDPVKIDLKTVCDYFYEEDLATRQIQVRYWKRLKYYWNNFSQVFWSEAENSYKVWGRDNVDGDGTNDQSYYDRPVNVFKAFLETIIAALSVNIPTISCVPDNADNPNDLATARAGNEISTLLYKHNNAIFLWLQALYVYSTEGLIACYTYKDEDEKYGTYQKKEMKDEDVVGYFCPSCKRQLDEEMMIQARIIDYQMKDKFDPGDSDVDLMSLGENEEPVQVSPEESVEPLVCPDCAAAIDPNLQKTTLTIPRLVGVTSHPKSRICMEVYGGLYVKIANYARKQADTPYLIWMFETHYVNVLETYPDLWDKIDKSGFSTQANDPIEQYARLNIQYRGTMPQDNVSVKTFWLRPSAFNYLETKEKADAMKKKYPAGCKVVIVNDVIAEHCAESLDDHWTLAHNPTSDYLNNEPMGEVLVNIQDIINDLISLTLQIIEHSISENWVDPGVVSLDAISQREVIPGAYTATKTVSQSKNISEAFYQTKAANLPPEIFNFYRIVNELGQFVSGALPSIFGGSQPGSETASEYAMAKGMALQRLQTPWKMLTIWWKGIFGKVIPMYMKCVNESDDERYVKKDQYGNFINVFIKRAELTGKIGDIELEASEQLPITEEQQKDIVLQLMQLNNAEIFEALAAPENLPFIRKIVRIPQFKLPGENDRQKQYEEIEELINSVPIPDELTGGLVSSVPIDPILDNHKVEGEICRDWLVGDAGRLAKKENIEGYTNVLLHFQEHTNELNRQAQVMAMTNQMAASGNGEQKQTGDKSQKPSGTKGKGPEKIKDASNVSTPVQ